MTASAQAQRSIILLSDGTGNSASKVWRTNVWRVFESLDLRSSSQVAIYDDGVGSSSFKPLALLGGGFGWGLKRNVLDLYCFLCRNYTPNADIYAFGFSRGAFTIRVLLGLVANQGLIHCKSESDLQRLAKEAYRAYRKERYHSVLGVETIFRAVRDAVLGGLNKLRKIEPYDSNFNTKPVPIRFVGVWDTVAAYGLPIEEMTRGISQWIWPLELPGRQLGPDVKRACHALALDDERTTFHPVLWSERNEKAAPADAEGKRWTRDERVSQVWFAGMHSNVGGGYPDDSLAHVPLYWMIAEAIHCGLKFKESPFADPDAVRHAQSASDKDGRLYDSRKGLGGYYRYGPRKIFDLCHVTLSQRPGDEVTIDAPKIHESAFLRTAVGAHAYAPIGLPETYEVVRAVAEPNHNTPRHEIVPATGNTFETAAAASVRASLQEQIWDLVWWRRVVYFATLIASLHLALLPVLYETRRAHEFESPLSFVSNLVRIVGGFLPGFANWWIDAFAANPATFLVGVIALVVVMMIGVALGQKIADRMRVLWTAAFAHALPAKANAPSGFVHGLRNSPLYKSVHWALKRHVIPLLSAIAVLYLGLAVVNHVLFDAQDTFGWYCKENTVEPRPLERDELVAASRSFDTKDPCWPTGFKIEEGARYRITVIESSEDRWRDKNFETQARGFEIGELPDFASRITMFAAIPLRRVLNRPWFRPIARIGAVGGDEYPLDPDTELSLNQPGSDRVIADFKARRSGELFLYVNDAVFGIPGLYRYFYDNNSGTGTVCLERLGRRTATGAQAKCEEPPSRRARPVGSK